MEDWEWELFDAYKDFILGKDGCIDADEIPDCDLLTIAEIIQHGVPGFMDADPKRAFELVDNMPGPSGMIGGFGLVEMLNVLDQRKLFLGNCFMKGLGVEQDFGEALYLFIDCGTDHLVQKWCGNMIDNQFDELYAMLIDAKDNSKDKYSKAQLKDIYLCLAIMTMEGLGCIADPAKAKEYLAKTDTYSKAICEPYYFDHEYLDRLCSLNARPYVPGMKLSVGDHIYVGKYNNRSVKWKVLDIRNGKALLLSDDVLESSYMLGQKAQGDWAGYWLMDALVNIDPETDSCLCNYEDGTGRTFILSPEEVEKYLPDPEDRICYYRNQALMNSTDNEDYGNNELATWWTYSKDEIDSDVRTYVDEEGEMYDCPIYRDNGIRPAMYIKLSESEEN